MSEFIEKEITFKRKGRNYYTNSYYSHIIASNMEIDRTVPAGIPPVPSGEAAVSFIEPDASGQPVRGRVIYEEQTNTEEQQNADRQSTLAHFLQSPRKGEDDGQQQQTDRDQPADGQFFSKRQHAEQG